jgi:hypothetical protein
LKNALDDVAEVFRSAPIIGLYHGDTRVRRMDVFRLGLRYTLIGLRVVHSLEGAAPGHNAHSAEVTP